MSSLKNSNRFRISIGTRLTLWSAGLCTLLIAAVCASLYGGMYFSMRSQIDAFLEGEIRELTLTANEHPNDDTGLQASLQKELGVRSRNDLGFRLINHEGQVFADSSIHDELQRTWQSPDHWNDTSPLLFCETLSPPGAVSRYRVCSLRVQLSDGRKCTSQATYQLKQMDESLARLRGICLALLAMAPLLSLVLGGFLSSSSLKPVRRIMDTANSIDASDLHARIPLTGTGDEMDRLAETLNEMLSRIECKVLEIQRFTADASHELRTPLAALRGTAEVVLSRPRSTEELRQTIEECLPQYERLQRIAEDLLFLARLDAGEPVIKSETVALDCAVKDVVDLYSAMAEEKGLTLTVTKLEPLLASGDSGRIRQVIGNVLDNAIKYTSPPGRIEVSLARVNGSAALEITDSGTGISASDLPRVFDRFFRADASRSAQSAPGTGLGLSICRSIIDAHGGTIDISNAPLQGTRVYITIPARTASSHLMF